MSAEDAALVRRCLRGETEAIRALVERFQAEVYGLCVRLLRHRHDAEDVAQEAVLKAFSKLASFRAESKFSTWIIQITYNEARMKLRKARRHLYESIDDQPQSEDGDFWPKDFADWRPIPSELLEENQMRQAIQNAIDSLSPNYREVLILRDIQDFSIKETMTILGISEANLKTRLHRARLLLRDSLAPGIDGFWSKGQPYRKVRPW